MRNRAKYGNTNVLSLVACEEEDENAVSPISISISDGPFWRRWGTS